MSNKNPFFTVGMCVHAAISNDQLKIAIDSIYAQTCQDFEFLIFVDGEISSECTSTLYRCAVTKGAKLIISSANIGLARGLNEIIKSMSGFWLLRMDADDYSVPIRMERLMHFITNNSDVDVVGSYMGEFSHSHMSLDRFISYPLHHDNMRAQFYTRNPLSHASSAISKRYLERVGSYPIISTRNEDTLMWLSGFLVGMRFSNIPEVLYHARYDFKTIGRRQSFKKAYSDCIDRLRVICDLKGSSFHVVIAISLMILQTMPLYGIVRAFLIGRPFNHPEG